MLFAGMNNILTTAIADKCGASYIHFFRIIESQPWNYINMAKPIPDPRKWLVCEPIIAFENPGRDDDNSDEELWSDDEIEDDDVDEPVDVAAPVPAPAAPRVDKLVEHMQRLGLEGNLATDPATREQHFWRIIELCTWRNRSDGAPTMPRNLFDIPAAARQSWREVYEQHYESARAVLEGDGLFRRNRMNSTDQARCISHIIAMGRDQYETLLNALDVVAFLWENNECQSFDSRLPDDLQH